VTQPSPREAALLALHQRLQLMPGATVLRNEVLPAKIPAGGLASTWIRRTRLGGEWQGATGTVPLAETTEAYEVDILNGSEVVRTLGARCGNRAGSQPSPGGGVPSR
jgi:hypothetical protein